MARDDKTDIDYLIAESIGYQLRIASSLMRRQFIARLSAAGLEISPEQVTLLTLLDRGQTWSLGEMAAANGHDKAAVTRMTQSMQESGWIRVQPDADSASRKRVSITASGRRLLTRVNAVVRDKEQGLERLLARGERRQLIGLLAKLQAGVAQELRG